MNKYVVYVDKIDKAKNENSRTIWADNTWRAKELTWRQIKDSNYLGWSNKREFMTEAKVSQVG